MDEGEKKKEDLGKWNKLKFLGMEGPSEDGMIPSNIRQEVTLWNKFRDDSPDERWSHRASTKTTKCHQ